MGGIFEAAGISGFLENFQERALAVDERAVAIRGFINTWWNAYHDEPVAARTLLPLALPVEAFNLADRAVAGDSDATANRQTRSLGRWLGKSKDAVFGDYQIVVDGYPKGLTNYKLQSILETPAAVVPDAEEPTPRTRQRKIWGDEDDEFDENGIPKGK
jgi:hypothetical protein